MAGEFKTPGGDDPQNRDTNRNRRQMPEASLHHHEGDGGSGPREIHSKEVGKKEQPIRSAREAFTNSMHVLDGFVEIARGSQKALRSHEASAFAAIDALKGDTEAVLGWIDRLDPRDVMIPSTTAKIYLRAVHLNNPTAAEKLHELLASERKNEIEEYNSRSVQGKSQKKLLDTSEILKEVIHDCALNNVPADVWLDRYSVNADNKAYQKVRYYLANKLGNSKHATETAQRYRDEVTQDFLQEDILSNQFCWDNINLIYEAQETPEQKRQIFERYKEIDAALVHDMEIGIEGMSFDMNTFLRFAKRYLDDPDVAQVTDVEWIEQTVEEFVNGKVNAGVSLYDATKNTNQVRLAIARFYGASPEEMIEKVDTIIGEQLAAAPEYAERATTAQRDWELLDCATQAAQTADLASARRFLSEIGTENFDLREAGAFFDTIKTPEALAQAKPDEMTLLFNEKLAELFSAREILLSDDPYEIHNFVESRISKNGLTEDDIEHIGQAMNRMYAQDRETGNSFAAYVIRKLRVRGYSPGEELFERLADIQLDAQDPSGWDTLYTYTKQVPEKDKIHSFTKLAFRAARVMQEEENAFENYGRRI